LPSLAYKAAVLESVSIMCGYEYQSFVQWRR
jgi:hypothetical protein